MLARGLLAAFSIALLAASPLMTACHNQYCGGDHVGDDDDDDDDDGDCKIVQAAPENNSTCSSFCDRLLFCGSIDASQYAACPAQCSARLSADADSVSKGCTCVVLDECRAVEDYRCPGAPLPQGGGQGGSSAQGGSGGSTAGSGTAGSGTAGSGTAGSGTAGSGTAGSSQQGGSSAQGGAGGAVGYACGINQDCASGEDCVEGTCRARCKASCQCHTGEVCDAGYCVPPQAPVESCANDCDCAAGQSCVGGGCQ